METLGFCTAGLAEIAKWVDQPAIRHFTQFGESLIRSQLVMRAHEPLVDADRAKGA